MATMGHDTTPEEPRWAILVQRHHNLVDRKYAAGLTPIEAEELNSINRQLDQLDSPLYQTMIDHARGMAEQREGVG